jgi:hypothetical protein
VPALEALEALEAAEALEALEAVAADRLELIDAPMHRTTEQLLDRIAAMAIEPASTPSDTSRAEEIGRGSGRIGLPTGSSSERSNSQAPRKRNPP